MIEMALVDNGIDRDVEMTMVRHFVVEGNKCKEDSIERRGSADNAFSHGSICGLVYRKMCSDSIIYSIKILDDNGRGMINKIQPALEWCLKNNIYLVNLSLGTTRFQDKNKVRDIVNHYANRGMVIIAASANSGYTTYPASFANVIGVAAGDSFGADVNLQRQKGIDFTAPSEDVIENNKKKVIFNKSNSYATPYVTAIAGKVLDKMKSFNILQVRQELLSVLGQEPAWYHPDWIETAWVSPKAKRSEAAYYFTEIKGNYTDCLPEADTVVICSRDEIPISGKTGRHLIYLGEEPIRHFEQCRYFWSREQRIRQITASETRCSDIDIPVIFFQSDAVQDELLWLGRLKENFAKDGYNAYTASQKIESVLYDLEYIPEELCDSGDSEKLHDFLYWQTFNGQADLIIMGISKEKCLGMKKDMVDLLINVWRNETDCTAAIYCDGVLEMKHQLKQNSGGDVSILYNNILRLLTEEMNE